MIAADCGKSGQNPQCERLMMREWVQSLLTRLQATRNNSITLQVLQPSSFALPLQRVTRNSTVKVVGSPRIPLLNTALSWAYRSHILKPFVVIVASINVLGLLLAGLIALAGCADGQSFATTFVLSVGQFVSFGEENSPRTSEAPGCVYLTVSASIVALLLQAFIFAFFVSRVLNPATKLQLAHQLCCEQRDGEFFLSFRIVHPQGHICSSLALSMIWLTPHTTAEGQTVFKNHRLEFVFEPRVIVFPYTLLVKLAGSPLEPHAADIQAAPGRLLFTYKGFDEVLRTSVFAVHHFSPRDIEFGSWRGTMIANPQHNGLDTYNITTAATNLAAFCIVDSDPTVQQRCRQRFGGDAPAQSCPLSTANEANDESTGGMSTVDVSRTRSARVSGVI